MSNAARQTADGRCQRSEIRNQKPAALAEQQMKKCARIARISFAKDLAVYKDAYELAMKIFEVSKRFPTEEKFALTSQIRRSSRSVCLNLREAWAKRRYEAHFVSKLTDSDGENSETDSSLDFARDCEYISIDEHRALTSKCAEIDGCSAE